MMCPEKIWINPTVAMELGHQPRYLSTADYVRGDIYKEAYQEGFKEALERIDSYAKCVAGEKGETCKWFAKNCLSFVPQGE